MELARQKAGEANSFGGKNSAGIMKFRLQINSQRLFKKKPNPEKSGNGKPRAYIWLNG